MNNSSTSPCGIDFTADQIFLPVLYGCVFCIGLPTNCLALYGLYRLIRADYTLPVYVINLLLSDLLHIATLPFWIDYYSRGHVWRFGKVACEIISCMLSIGLFVSIFFMCCTALERYLVIVHPFWFQSQRKIRNVYLLSLVIWVFFISSVTVGFSLGFKGDATGSLCSEHFPANTEFAAYRLVSIPITFLLPLLFLLFVLFRVRRSLAQSLSIPEQEKRRFTGLLILIMLMFLLIFGPYHLAIGVRYTWVIVATNKCQFESKIFLGLQISWGLISVNALLDPVMYIFIYKNTRKRMLDCCLCFQRISRSTNNNNTLIGDLNSRPPVQTVS